jgi:fructose-bisphosphate aldolase class I
MEDSVMTATELDTIARAMVAKDKGILAADESSGTIKKRFDKIKLESTEENRRTYRELLFTTPGASDYISGVILYDETLRQKTRESAVRRGLTRNGMVPHQGGPGRQAAGGLP